MAVDGWVFCEVTAGRLKTTGRNPTDRGKQCVKHSLIIDANGLHFSLVVSGRNIQDIKPVADTLDALQTGRPGRTLRVSLDKRYAAGWLEAYLKSRRCESHIQSRNE